MLAREIKDKTNRFQELFTYMSQRIKMVSQESILKAKILTNGNYNCCLLIFVEPPNIQFKDVLNRNLGNCKQ